MTTSVLLLHYNNYFNRTVKKLSTVQQYVAADPNESEVFANINFVPGDGVSTQMTIGFGTNPEGYFEEGFDYDYAVVFDSSDQSQPISSRWFVMHSERTRQGQYELVLRRDVLVDFYDDFVSAPCFIEKATIDDIDNCLLYNDENYKVNQIKTTESLIKDISNVAWVVGYIAPNMASGAISGNAGTITLGAGGQASGALTMSNNNYTSFYITLIGQQTALSGFTYSFDTLSKVLTYSINNPAYPNTSVVIRWYADEPASVEGETYKVNLSGSSVRRHLQDAPYDMFCIPFGEIKLQTANVTTELNAALEIAMEMSKDLGSNLYDIQLLPYCPRSDMVGDNKVYEAIGLENFDYNYIYKGQTKASIVLWCKKSTIQIVGIGEKQITVPRPLESIMKQRQITFYSATLTKVSSLTNKATVTLTDSEFKNQVISSVTSLTVSNGTYSDIVPPANIEYIRQTDGSAEVSIDYTGSSFPTGTASVTVGIGYKYKNYENPKYLDYKISNECDVFRLISPNYNGQFEWSIAKSNGSAIYFDIDCTFKPYQPYIHLSPQFTKLYGRDFNDARGLICGGDFSLPVANDAWTQYQIQNKTYQEVFDRQIQNMDTMWAMESERNALAGAIGIGTGTLAGAAGGMKAGGPLGALIGGSVGLGLSTAGMVMDTVYAQKAQEENRSFAYDMFNYGLQNVQALPYSLTKVAAYTANNKIFPMVEYYTCSDIEKDAFKDKLKYNGMSVNVIGNIGDYVVNGEQRFIKGQIIRLPNLKEDSHMANEIYNEISKGVYI